MRWPLRLSQAARPLTESRLPPMLVGMKHSVMVLSLIAVMNVNAEEMADPNYDESKVPAYRLPPVLTFEGGDHVASPEDWERRRAELFDLFADHIYGIVPAGVPSRIYPKVRRENPFLEGRATLKEVRVHLIEEEGPYVDLLLISPGENAPTFLGYNFGGNHTVHPSVEISLPESWMRPSKSPGAVIDHRATEAGRGVSTRWPVAALIEDGFALATAYYGDIDPDFDDGFENGIHAATGRPAAGEWGSIATWAWGLSRLLDYLETDALCDGEKVAVFGHSRLGKTALWAGATDPRFAMVISNNSGCGGAALSRRRFGERLMHINTRFPHWFNDRFPDYNEREHELPVDQHQLLALIAPRPLHVASASQDRWADPRGEFLSAREASAAYEALGKQGLGREIRYHLRAGRHDVTDFDWDQFKNTFRSEILER